MFIFYLGVFHIDNFTSWVRKEICGSKLYFIWLPHWNHICAISCTGDLNLTIKIVSLCEYLIVFLLFISALCIKYVQLLHTLPLIGDWNIFSLWCCPIVIWYYKMWGLCQLTIFLHLMRLLFVRRWNFLLQLTLLVCGCYSVFLRVNFWKIAFMLTPSSKIAIVVTVLFLDVEHFLSSYTFHQLLEIGIYMVWFQALNGEWIILISFIAHKFNS